MHLSLFNIFVYILPDKSHLLRSNKRKITSMVRDLLTFNGATSSLRRRHKRTFYFVASNDSGRRFFIFNYPQ